MNKRQPPTIRLNLTVEEVAMLKHWCIDHHVTMCHALSNCARKLMRTKIIQPTESVDSDNLAE